MKKTYLIDTENVSLLLAINKIEKKIGNTIVAFMHKETTPKNREIAEVLVSLVCEEGLECKILPFIHKNANDLDFQISSYLGWLLSKSTKEEEYIIISNDKGYDSMITNFQNYGFLVRREKILTSNDINKNEIMNIDIDEWFRTLFILIQAKESLTNEEKHLIIRLVRTDKIENKISNNELHNLLQKSMNKNKASTIYNILKKQLLMLDTH